MRSSLPFVHRLLLSACCWYIFRERVQKCRLSKSVKKVAGTYHTFTMAENVSLFFYNNCVKNFDKKKLFKTPNVKSSERRRLNEKTIRDLYAVYHVVRVHAVVFVQKGQLVVLVVGRICKEWHRNIYLPIRVIVRK